MVSGHLATRLVPSRYLCVFGVTEDSYVSFVPSHDTPRARQSNPQSSLTAKTHKWQLGTSLPRHQEIHLTIKVGSEWIAHEDDDPMGYWLRGYEGERNNCFSKIRLVGKKYRDKTTLASKTRLRRHCLGFQSRRFETTCSQRTIDNTPLVGFY